MRKIKLYMAISLDGKIALPDGSVEWLETIPPPEDGDYGYKDFYASIDTTIQGYTTYQQVINWGIDFPYADKKNYVVTGKQGLTNTEYVEFISQNHIEFIKSLKEAQGKDIWLVGGGKLNAMLLEANLIDDLLLYIMPVILTKGIDMFSALPSERPLKLVASKVYANGVVETRYTARKN
jgi:dihydrofolate reductase